MKKTLHLQANDYYYYFYDDHWTLWLVSKNFNKKNCMFQNSIINSYNNET